MNRQTRWNRWGVFSVRMVPATVGLAALGVALMLGGASGGRAAVAAETQPASQPAETLTIKGTCTFGGKQSNWSAKLTPKGDNLYDAAYTASWGGSPLEYKGTIKSDFKTEIAGEGKATKGGNGTFQFAGKYDKNGVAQCKYAEVGGRRSGTLTAEVAKK